MISKYLNKNWKEHISKFLIGEGRGETISISCNDMFYNDEQVTSFFRSSSQCIYLRISFSLTRIDLFRELFHLVSKEVAYGSEEWQVLLERIVVHLKIMALMESKVTCIIIGNADQLKYNWYYSIQLLAARLVGITNIVYLFSKGHFDKLIRNSLVNHRVNAFMKHIQFNLILSNHG